MSIAKISIFNDILGPIMHGPSSSHTAAAFRLGRYLRSVFPGELRRVRVTFRSGQTYARTFRQQRGDLAFTAGFLGLAITDPDYDHAHDLASRRGLVVEFADRDLPWAVHPNGLEMEAEGDGAENVVVKAVSVGGGSIRVLGLNEWNFQSGAESYDMLAAFPAAAEGRVKKLLAGRPALDRQRGGDVVFVRASFDEPAPAGLAAELRAVAGMRIWLADPVALVTRGEPLFIGAAGAERFCREYGLNLAEAGIRYEAALTGLTETEIEAKLDSILAVMLNSVADGLAGQGSGMVLLQPSARKIFQAGQSGRLPFGGLNTRTGARALAAMEICSSGGLVTAAPTAGSAGIVPAVLAAVAERWPDSPRKVREAVMAGAVVGLVFAQGATFAAEVGGCQVEVGASAAMAAGAAVMAGGGDPDLIFQAAGLMLQNYMGLICDPVRGYVELPCQIRNALAASSALTAADLTLGGYVNPVPFDEAVAAALDTGRLLPMELRCTTLGGIAVCPSMQKL